MSRRAEDVAPQIRSLLVLGSSSGLTDGQLLGRFASEGADPEASSLAFEVLVRRHGPMVLRVCRGVLRDPHDAQDAFQATFLVLVRKAGSIRDRESVASWLHGVALRVANHARGSEARRRRLERGAVEGRAAGSPPTREPADDLGPTLHEEVGRLPERYRAAVVLCYLEGLTCEDAARVLQWPVGTVKSRLSRAREKLRGRLSRQGLALPAVPGAMAASSTPTPRLVQLTAELAARFGARSAAPASGAGVVTLAEGVLRMMTLAKLKLPALALLVAGSSWLGVASALPLAPAPSPAVVQEPPRSKAKEPIQAPASAPAPAAASDPVALTLPGHLSATAGGGTAIVYALNPRGERVPEDSVAKIVARQYASKAGSKDLLTTDRLTTGLPWKEVETDLRWVAVTGVVDNQKVREAEARARKLNLAEAFPYYRRAELERQVRKPDGAWSEWVLVDQARNYEVLDNLPELSGERTPVEVRPPSLVDPLPLLKKGTWVGVDPEPVLKLPPPRPDKVAADKRPLLGSPLLAIRCLDFTVEPGATYRYRVRVLLVNPDRGQGQKRELLGPWSGPTPEAAVGL